ncbi:MAG TPA: phosphodiester glycosidase family protein [Allosphingosinicella sp.]|jgi:uncharacterized protein YigE (DUF2233 family)
MAAIRSSLFLLLALAACEAEPPQGPANQAAAVAAALPEPACESRRFEGSPFTICAYRRGEHEIRLAWKGADGRPLRSLAALEQALGPDASRVRFAMNAGMYDEEGAPIGLYVEQGKTLKAVNIRSGPGNFHLLPNGVFAVASDGSVSAARSTALRRLPPPHWATQSGPMLVIEGKLHPKIDEDGPSRFVRNGVGVKDPRTAFFVISEEGVSFGRMARLFRDVLGCRNALYFDGSVSSLWDRGAGRQDLYSSLGPMVVVLERKQP